MVIRRRAELDGNAWGRAPYQPTPTIVEAAHALYARHTVEAITRNDAGAKNLQVTSSRVEEIIERTRARANHGKAIVLVTGVPGAGKTLVGGGQEIHTGEAGIGARLEALGRAFPNWRTHVSPDLSASEYAAAAQMSRATSPAPRSGYELMRAAQSSTV